MAELTPQTISIQSLYSQFADNKLLVNRRYQRKLVWTTTEKQKLVESILRKYPIPAILVAEREGEAGTYEIIDGLQRLHAIMSFIETAYPTLDQRYFDVNHFPTAKSRASAGKFVVRPSDSLLTPKEVSTFLDYSISLSVMRNATESEVNDVFDRINTYGHRLSDQERRQAGTQNSFSDMVREISCTIRGDVSLPVLELEKMPSISIDLPMSRHGYEVKAEDVFWVAQGILRSTDLRDSMDEQCVADLAACIIGGKLIERSKDALDAIYEPTTAESKRIMTALAVYGEKKFAEELKFCIDEVLKVCNAGHGVKLRDLIFKNRTSNAFPSIFAVILIAFHELIVREKKGIADYLGVQNALMNVTNRVGTTRTATKSDERRKNVNTIKGLISPHFVDKDLSKAIYGNHASTDIDALIRRSEVELADYELKQGLLTLSPNRKKDDEIINKVVRTVCAIANNGRGRTGKVLIGIADKKADADRVKSLDGVDPLLVGSRYVVGVNREAAKLGVSKEEYFSLWRDGIANSDLSEPLKSDVLSLMDYNEYFGNGVIVFTVPPQVGPSFVGDKLYWRNGDQTEEVQSQKHATEIAGRFINP
ncbi:DUF262 domain-containing protein [Xanthomonas sacchari]|uniref:DUF262 domain-containing protein n=1 Tax=Xanthomonas sacchari TaxID=56458 RepID=UPI00225E205D|nr:DUF262 domain-containing protein [Xanthomonas sacchari]MCW0423188.1 hypothetical protein [Xanthomonas sacchari]